MFAARSVIRVRRTTPAALVVIGAMALESIAVRPALAAIEGEGVDKAHQAVRVASPPELDGVLDDAAWQAAKPDDRFTQSFPDEGVAPSERTEIRVVYDDVALYVGVRLYDQNPDQIVRRLARRDRDVEGDAVTVLIDSRHDHATALFFRLTAGGAMVDGQYIDDVTVSSDWDGVWEGASSVQGDGWSAEFRIPLATLRFSAADEQEWGFQVIRYLSRRKETSLWTYSPRSVRGVVSRAGHLRGISRLAPHRVFEMRPFVLMRMRSSSTAGGVGLTLDEDALDDGLDAGFDGKVGLSSDLVLDVTVRPDFGQIEADQIVLNMTRFETFLPEKRPFFVEGTDVFKTPLQQFYSRRIGRSLSGLEAASPLVINGSLMTVERVDQAARLHAAAKIVGKLSPAWSIAVLEALTGAESVVLAGEMPTRERVAPAQNVLVARARWSPGGVSYLGATATAATRLGSDMYLASANHDAYTEGVDGQWQSNDGVWRVTAHGVSSQRVGGSSHQGPLGERCEPGAIGCLPISRPDGTVLAPGAIGYGGTVVAERLGEHWTTHADYTGLSRQLDLNDVGFLPEFGTHNASLGVGYRDTNADGWLRSYESDTGGIVVATTDGTVMKQGVGLNLGAQHRSFVAQTLSLASTFGRMWDPYETGDGARFQVRPGATLRAGIATDDRKPVALGSNLFMFHAYGSRLFRSSLDLTVSTRAGERTQLQLGSSLTWDANTPRFHSCIDEVGAQCHADSRGRDYLFADLDAVSLSFLTRGSLALSQALALDVYAQLFLARGQFDRYRGVTTVGREPQIEERDLALVDPGARAGGDFRDARLNANLVLRWDLRGGATVLAAVTRSQEAAIREGDRPRLHLGGINDGKVDNVVLVKFVVVRS